MSLMFDEINASSRSLYRRMRGQTVALAAIWFGALAALALLVL
ncbi:MAG: hypothetical protein Q4F72_10690 [Desulfovibrionaceae bacterium]|nr:hypothetical protein [Desulfovibrionaceae bacterium]